MSIKIEHISKKYGEYTVLEDFSLELPEGKIICIMAPSGRGKTTLLRMLMHLEDPDRGSITGLEGKCISAVFQEDRLCENLSVAANIRLAMQSDGTRGKENRRRIQRGLTEAGIEAWTDRPVRELSGGMKRRVAILRALYAPWDLLLMDEPFQGMDLETRERMMEQIRREAGKRTILFVTHDESEAQKMGAVIIRI